MSWPHCAVCTCPHSPVERANQAAKVNDTCVGRLYARVTWEYCSFELIQDSNITFNNIKVPGLADKMIK